MKILKGFELNHFKGNILKQFNKDRNVVAITTLEKEFEKEFCVETKTLDTFSKIGSLEDIKVNKNEVLISNGKSKLKSLLKEIPNVTIEFIDVIYKDEYNVKDLLKATNFVAKDKSRPQFCGVIFDNLGNVYSTDSFQMFYRARKNIDGEVRFSVPIDFIKIIGKEIENDKVNISFSNNLVLAEFGDTKLYGCLYSGVIPKMIALVNSAKCEQIINIEIDDDLFLLEESNLTKISSDAGDNVNFNFDNGITTYNVEYSLKEFSSAFSVTLSTQMLKNALIKGENIVELCNNNKLIKVNNEVLLIPVRV